MLILEWNSDLVFCFLLYLLTLQSINSIVKKKSGLFYEDHLANLKVLTEKVYSDQDMADLKANLPVIDPWNSNVTSFVLDYRKKNYDFFGKSSMHVLGYPAEAFREGGLEFTTYIWNRRDYSILNNHIFTTNHQFLSNYEEEKPDDFRISYTFRVANGCGGWEFVLQQSTLFYSTELQLPIASYGTVTNITDYKTDSRMTHKIERKSANGVWTTISMNNYFPDVEEERLLTKTEIEVLKWLMDGCTSQDIADKLNRSLHTIQTHRKNMMVKTNARNTTDLLRIAISKGLI